MVAFVSKTMKFSPLGELRQASTVIPTRYAEAEHEHLRK